MSKIRKTLIVVLAAATIIGILAPAAFAGSFHWYGFFTHRLVSRTYVVCCAGTHRITTLSNSICNGPGNSYQIRVVHEEFGPDTFYAWKSYNCGVAGARQWAIPQTGDFHFDVEKINGDTTSTWYVEGDITYP
jgi:hypothetical protein